MKRRNFIHLSAYTAIALCLPLTDGCASTANVLEQPLLFSHLADAKTIAETGKAYLKQFPAEGNKARLTELLLGNSFQGDKKAIRTLLDNHVEQDFKTGKIVTASGWVLSVTEARQCALYSILNA